MLILGIETSCDETAAAVIQAENNQIEVKSNIISSQIDIHRQYGGVVPEVAAREHAVNIIPVVQSALQTAAGETPATEYVKQLDAIAVTAGPGLITSLIVGVETAKTLAFAWQIPLIGVNHIKSHFYANFINYDWRHLRLPAIALTVSGGHTSLMFITALNTLEKIGDTRDDAAGEAFDKAAQMLGLGYPGGPAIAAAAAKATEPINNKLPRPMLQNKDLDFSFSGLKTALLYELKKDKTWRDKIPAYAAEFQQAVIDVLIAKTIKAAKKHQAKTIFLAGGVSANRELREQLKKAVSKQLPQTDFQLPDLNYCTDNAAMVAAAACFQASQKQFSAWEELTADSNLEL